MTHGASDAERPLVAIVHDAAAADGPPDASDTLLEAAAIRAALEALGTRTAIVPASLDLGAFEQTLATLEPTCVFNLVESLGGRGRLIHVVPALLEALDMPFTGCSAAALLRSSNKLLAKREMLRAGLPTPALFESPASAGARAWIVKSVFEHASFGLDDSAVVRGAEAVAETLEARRREYGGAWFAEAFVPGRELNVALLATPVAAVPRVLPVAEIVFRGFPDGKPKIVGYAAKWHPDSFEYRNTQRSFDVEPGLAERAAELALACWRLFELAGYARVDLRVDRDGSLYVLEINANPALAPDAGFAAALAAAGIDYARAVEWIVEAAQGAG